MPPYNHYNKLDKEYKAYEYTKNNPNGWMKPYNIYRKILIPLIDKYQVKKVHIPLYQNSYIQQSTTHKNTSDLRIYWEIRKGYYGGIVDVEHLVQKAYKYDSNCHYPAAMLNDMPVADPVISDEKDNRFLRNCT